MNVLSTLLGSVVLDDSYVVDMVWFLSLMISHDGFKIYNLAAQE
jgi:hypothetical protein